MVRLPGPWYDVGAAEASGAADWSPYARWSAYPYNEKLHTGEVTVDGKFAVLEGTSHPTSTGVYTGYAYVEKCGSRARRPTSSSSMHTRSAALAAALR
jgi:hypothetical protein